ncbi:MAG: Autotransporter-associated beta strand repeat protein [Lentisphaerae bacterium ADurb.BinA184]|nr:MAG: Autotransporter-associated beta strand repeat protein [Lentisphaerae bacterium ADurb.BinA184]
MQTRLGSIVACTLAAGLLGAGLALPLRAADMTWDGGGGDLTWATGLNWTGTPDNTAPGAGDTALFTAAGLNVGDTVLLGPGQSVGGLSFNLRQNLTLGGSGSLELGAGGLNRAPSAAGTQTLAVPVTLGSGPLAIGSSSGGVTVSGIATGSAGITKQLSGMVAFTNYTHAITGNVSIASGGGTLRLGGMATLQYPTSFIVDGGGVLEVNNNLGTNLPDRIRDDASIVLRGGTIRGTGGNEHFGNVTAAAGPNYIAGNNILTINALTRNTGATVGFGDNIAGGNTVTIVQAPTLVNGLMVGGAGFWSYNQGRVRTLSQAISEGVVPALVTDINAGAATDNFNVYVSDATPTATLTSSRSINSLQFGGQDSGVNSVLDLGTNTLTLTSGYFGGTTDWMRVTNGTLIPAGNELFVQGPGNGNRTITFDGVLADNGNPVNVVLFGGNNITFAGTNTFSGNLYINGTNVSFSGANSDATIPNVPEIHLNGGALNAGTGLTKPIIFDNSAIGLNSGAFNVANQLRGTAFISKGGDSDVTISQANPNLSATFAVNRGSLTAPVAGALGSSEVLVNYADRGGTLNYNATGITSNPKGVTVCGEGNVNIGANLTVADRITVKALGRISGTDARLATLDYNAGNLTLDEDAIIYKSSGTATGGITNLPNDAKWYFRAGSMPAGLTVGAGTPWKGVSTMSMTTGTLNVNSDFYLNTIGASNGNNLTLGNGTNASTLTVAGAGGSRYTAYITNSPGNNALMGVVLDAGGAAPTADYSGVSKFSVTNGAYLRLSRDNTMGGVAGPGSLAAIEVRDGGMVDADSAGAFNGNVNILSGGALIADVSGGLSGVGTITVNPGGIVAAYTNTALNGTQLTPASVPGAGVIRIMNGVNDVQGINNLSNPVVFELSGHDINSTSHTQTSAGDWTLNNGAMITNHQWISGMTLANTAGGNIVIAPTGGVFSATTGSTFTISESIDSLAGGDITIGYGGTVSGATKTGTVLFNAANNITGGTIHVVNGATLSVGNTNQIGSAAMSLEGGSLVTSGALAATNVTVSGASSLIASGGSRTFNNLTMTPGATLTANAADSNNYASTFNGTTTLDGVNTFITPRFPRNTLTLGQITGTGAFVKDGVGSATVNYNGGDVAFTGDTLVNAGTLTWARSGFSAANQSDQQEFVGTLDLGGLLQFGSNDNDSNPLVYSGTITVNRESAAPRGLLGTATWSRITEFRGNIVDSVAGAHTQPVVMREGRVTGTGNTYAGGTLVEAIGYVNDLASARKVEVAATSSLGTGNVEVMPGGRLKLNSIATNLGAGATVTVASNGRLAGQVEIAENIAPTFLSSESNGILALAVNNTQITDMATLGGGSMFLGGNGGHLNSATLAPGSGDTYRFAMNSGNTTAFNVNAVLSDVGATPSNVLVGAVPFIPSGRVILNTANTYSGQTTVFSGNLGATAQASGSPLGSTSGLDMKAGSFEYLGVTGVAGTLAIPATDFAGGSPQVGTRLGGAGSTLDLDLGTVTRDNRATPAVYAASGALGTSQFIRAAGVGLTPVNGIVAPWLMDNAGNFLSNGGNGLVANTAGSTNNINIADPNAVVVTGAAALTANNAIYALKTTGNIAGTATLTLRSGGFISTGNTISPNLAFADGATPVEGIINVTTGTMSINGSVTAAEGITKTGTGAVQFNAATNNITGDVTINSGSLNYTSGTNLGSARIVLNGGALAAATGAAAHYVPQDIYLGNLGGGIVMTEGRETLTHRGTISGPGALTVTGAYGNSSLSYTFFEGAAPSTYSGGTVLRYGNVGVGLTSSLGTGDVYLDAVTLDLYGDGNIAPTATLTIGSMSTVNLYAASPTVGALAGVGPLNLNDSDVQLGGAMDAVYYGNINGASGVGALTKVGTGTQTLLGIASYSGPTTLDDGRLRIESTDNIGAGPVVFTGDSTLEIFGSAPFATSRAMQLDAAGTLEVTNSAGVTWDGELAGAGSLTKDGPGELTLTAANSYAGGTVIEAGRLIVSADDNLGTGGVTFSGDATLALTGAAAFATAKPLTLDAAGTVEVTNPAGASWDGAIGGAGSLTKTGPEALALTGGNSYAGGTVLADGRLIVSADGNLGTGDVTVAGAATLEITGGTPFASAKGMTLDADVALDITNTAGASWGGAIAGVGSLTKTGPGTLTLTGDNLYQGGTALPTGTLLVSNLTGSGTGLGPVTTDVGTTLGGSGILAPVGDATIMIGGNLAPGDGVGTLTFDLRETAGALTLEPTSTLTFELDVPGTGDDIAIWGSTGGNVAFNGNVLDFVDLGGLSEGGVFTLFSFFEDDGVTPMAHGFGPGDLVLGSGLPPALASQLVYSNNGGTTIDLAIFVIPEPAAVVLAGLGALLLTGRARRRERRA